MFAACPALAAGAQTVRLQPMPAVVARIPCTAHVSNARPKQRTTIYVIVAAWEGIDVTTHALYKTTTTTKHARTNRQTGRASVAYRISTATVGYAVVVHIVVRKGARRGACSTSFVPQR
jgi:hypothetical protein